MAKTADAMLQARITAINSHLNFLIKLLKVSPKKISTFDFSLGFSAFP